MEVTWKSLHAAIQIVVLSSTYSFYIFCCWFLKGIVLLFSNEDNEDKESNTLLQFKQFSTQFKSTGEKFVLSNHIFPSGGKKIWNKTKRTQMI